MQITTLDALRQLYAQPTGRVLGKQIGSLDAHCRRFIALSPFVVVSTSDDAHNADASPRGGEPGFVKVDAEGRLLIPDSPGNNRLDSLENIVRTGKLGLLFMIPGFDETLRVNGGASLSVAPDDIALCTTERRAPKLVIRVTVREAYLHCAKAFLRSKLWSESAKVDRSLMPTIGQ
ncbi:MAG TPA: MSMEG_1061 family FMN-dependent PPOX-type flavoprotein, partial [Quisquiliibacterium sp.]|nr:MSMEG_1061 family FMN-dependent PPOX-type flavoprotein [Quisquiliibacterium sp.]